MRLAKQGKAISNVVDIEKVLGSKVTTVINRCHLISFIVLLLQEGHLLLLGALKFAVRVIRRTVS